MSENKEFLDSAGKVLKILASLPEDDQRRIVAMMVEAVKPTEEE